MNIYQTLVETVIISNKNHLIRYSDSLKLIGIGRSAFVFRIKASNLAIKIFFPAYKDLAKEEVEVYRALRGIPYFPTVHDSGSNYIVMDYIEGDTIFDCVTQGTTITPEQLKEVDYALSLAADQKLNPSDIHLRNIIITPKGRIMLIDVARFRQEKNCMQWRHLKTAYHHIYKKRFFPKKIPAIVLNIIAFIYKKRLLPFYRSNRKSYSS